MWAAEAAGDFLAYNEVLNNPLTKGVQLALGGVGVGGFGGWLASKRIKKKIKQRATILSQGMTGKRLRGSDVPIVTPSKPERISYNRQENGDPYAGGGPVELMPEMDVVGGGGVPVRKSTIKFAPLAVGKGAQLVQVVGNPDDVKEDGYVRFPSVGGWRMNRKKWVYSRVNYSPLTVLNGDLLSTSSTTLGTPASWITSGTSQHSGDTVGHINYFSDLAGMQKELESAPSTFKAFAPNWFASKGSDIYADLCIPVFPIHAYGQLDVGSTNSNLPLGALDLFTKVKDGATVSGSIFDYNIEELGMNPYTMLGPTGSNPGGDVGIYGSSTSNDTGIQECFVMVETDFILNNNSGQSQTFEILQVLPRRPVKSSPIADMTAAYFSKMEGNSTLDRDAYRFARIGSDPREYKHFRDSWRVNKKVITVQGGASIKIKMKVPLSQLNRDVLLQLKRGESNPVSVPGLTQWLWLRVYGIHGYDHDSTSMGNNPGGFVISMYQKYKVWHIKPKINKVINLINYCTSVADINLSVDEQNAVQNDTNNPLGN